MQACLFYFPWFQAPLQGTGMNFQDAYLKLFTSMINTKIRIFLILLLPLANKETDYVMSAYDEGKRSTLLFLNFIEECALFLVKGERTRICYFFKPVIQKRNTLLQQASFPTSLIIVLVLERRERAFISDLQDLNLSNNFSQLYDLGSPHLPQFLNVHLPVYPTAWEVVRGFKALKKKKKKGILICQKKN